MKQLAAITLTCFLAACVTVPPNTFNVTPEKLQDRQLQTRRYDGISNQDLLVASSNVLQDIGFNLENSETKLGILTGSKQRDISAGEKTGEIILAVLVAAMGGGSMPLSRDQNIRVSLVVRPVLNDAGSEVEKNNFVRVTFQRVVNKTDGSAFAQTLKESELYQEFFDKVSKAVFLEAQKI